jgi:Protein of unknown function (DUF2281)
MSIEATILQNLEKLPNAVKQSVLLYTEFLVSQQVVLLEADYGYGSLAEQIVMADDFDEPLDLIQCN